jgi:hypothetical protein
MGKWDSTGRGRQGDWWGDRGLNIGREARRLAEGVEESNRATTFDNSKKGRSANLAAASCMWIQAKNYRAISVVVGKV